VPPVYDIPALGIDDPRDYRRNSGCERSVPAKKHRASPFEQAQMGRRILKWVTFKVKPNCSGRFRAGPVRFRGRTVACQDGPAGPP